MSVRFLAGGCGEEANRGSTSLNQAMKLNAEHEDIFPDQEPHRTSTMQSSTRNPYKAQQKADKII